MSLQRYTHLVVTVLMVLDYSVFNVQQRLSSIASLSDNFGAWQGTESDVSLIDGAYPVPVAIPWDVTRYASGRVKGSLLLYRGRGGAAPAIQQDLVGAALP
ncbi:MAG: hypothetical protein MI924_17890 [Chloroflexales bacterium]|nr:hypothetical protein [Chloroflexales bacterium]